MQPYTNSKHLSPCDVTGERRNFSKRVIGELDLMREKDGASSYLALGVLGSRNIL